MMTPFYDKNGITIYCGDCLEIMPGLEPPIDAVIADLPYGTTECTWDLRISLDDLWYQYNRLLKLNGISCMFGQDPFSSILTVSNIENYRHKLIWIKDKAANFLAAPYSPLKFTEDILIFSRCGFANNSNTKATYNPQMKISKKRNDRSGETRKGGSLLQLKPRPDTSHKALNNRKLKFAGEYVYPKNFVYYSVPFGKDRMHPTQKPVTLLSYLIRTYTNPGELILDNTMGSGTTLVAAQNEGRRAIGIDISEEYCAIAVDRLRQPSFFSLPQLNGNGHEPQPQQLELI